MTFDSSLTFCQKNMCSALIVQLIIHFFLLPISGQDEDIPLPSHYIFKDFGSGSGRGSAQPAAASSEEKSSLPEPKQTQPLLAIYSEEQGAG